MSLLTLTGSRRQPSPPDRMTLMRKPWHFQGLRVPIDGLTGWFDPALAWIDASKRPQVYATKDAAGDLLYGLALSGQYNEPGQPYAQYAGVDFSKNLPALNALYDEILAGNPNRAVRLFCAGDSQGAGPGYNDPQGMTYGHDWLMAFFPTLVASLGWRCRFTQFYPGFDSVFYGWDPSQVQAFGSLVRATLSDPNIVLGIEHDVGHIPVGNGPADYAPGGMMDGYDLISSEYFCSPYLQHTDAVWQVNARARYASDPYNRPPDQPSGDDPNPPAYFQDSPRGPRLHECLEWATYCDVRGNCTPAGIDQDRAYLRAMVPNSLIA